MWKVDLIERLSRWADGELVAPQRVLMYPTNRCNLRCRFCYQELSPYDLADTMPKSKWLALTGELCDMGVRTLQISGGGEPLVVAETVLDMMRIIKQSTTEGRLVTNGTLWRKPIIDEMVDIEWNYVISSIDGPEAAVHDWLRGVPGSFEKTCAGIRMFRDEKERRGTEIPLLEFSSVITNTNYKTAPDIVRLAYSLGVKVITFEPAFVSNPFVHKIKLSEEQNREYMTEIAPRAAELADSLGIIHNLHVVSEIEDLDKTGDLRDKIMDDGTGGDDCADEGPSFRDADAGPERECRDEAPGEAPINPFYNLLCYEPWCWPKIEANGEVGPCSTNMLDDVNIKGLTFSEIWFGPPFEKFRRTIRDRNLPSGCSNCVSTHVPLNKEIRARLIEYRKKTGKY